MAIEGRMSLGEVAALLRDMQDAEGIAWLCDMFDVRGSKAWPPSANCVVAILAQKLTGEMDAFVGTRCVSAGPSYARETEYIGDALSVFTDDYDGGRWPELEGK